jgi:hypothetical protein
MSIAVVSGDEGSGTAPLTALGALFVDAKVGPDGQNVFVMDADVRGGALTALLRSRLAGGPAESGPGEGLSGFAADPTALAVRPVSGRLRDLRSLDGRSGDCALLPVGDPAVLRALDEEELRRTVVAAVERLRELTGFVLVDCGLAGRVETLAVCGAVEHVALVVGARPAAVETAAARYAELVAAGVSGRTSLCLWGGAAGDPAIREALGRALPGLPVALTLPADPAADQAVGRGELPPLDGPLAASLRSGMEASVPDVFRSYFRD